MKVAVIGANGQVGQSVVQAFEEHDDEVFALTHAEIEIASVESVRTAWPCCSPMS